MATVVDKREEAGEKKVASPREPTPPAAAATTALPEEVLEVVTEKAVEEEVEKQKAVDAATASTGEKGGVDEVYCICQKANVEMTLIGCDNCNEWYHLDCVNVTEQQLQTIENYTCPVCCHRQGISYAFQPSTGSINVEEYLKSKKVIETTSSSSPVSAEKMNIGGTAAGEELVNLTTEDEQLIVNCLDEFERTIMGPDWPLSRLTSQKRNGKQKELERDNLLNKYNFPRNKYSQRCLANINQRFSKRAAKVISDKKRLEEKESGNPALASQTATGEGIVIVPSPTPSTSSDVNANDIGNTGTLAIKLVEGVTDKAIPTASAPASMTSPSPATTKLTKRNSRKSNAFASSTLTATSPSSTVATITSVATSVPASEKLPSTATQSPQPTPRATTPLSEKVVVAGTPPAPAPTQPATTPSPPVVAVPIPMEPPKLIQDDLSDFFSLGPTIDKDQILSSIEETIADEKKDMEIEVEQKRPYKRKKQSAPTPKPAPIILDSDDELDGVDSEQRSKKSKIEEEKPGEREKEKEEEDDLLIERPITPPNHLLIDAYTKQQQIRIQKKFEMTKSHSAPTVMEEEYVPDLSLYKSIASGEPRPLTSSLMQSPLELDPETPIEIKVQFADDPRFKEEERKFYRKPQKYKIRYNQRFDKVIFSFCELKRIHSSSIVFKYKGVPVYAYSTPKALMLRNGDTIDASTHELEKYLASRPPPPEPSIIISASTSSSTSATTTSASTPTPPAEEMINLKFKFPDNRTEKLRIKKASTFQEIVAGLSKRFEIPKLELHFDGEKLEASETPKDVDMEDEYTVDVIIPK